MKKDITKRMPLPPEVRLVAYLMLLTAIGGIIAWPLYIMQLIVATQENTLYLLKSNNGWRLETLGFLISLGYLVAGIALLRRSSWARHWAILILCIQMLYVVSGIAIEVARRISFLHDPAWFMVAMWLIALLVVSLVHARPMLTLLFLTLPGFREIWPDATPDRPAGRLGVISQRLGNWVERLLLRNTKMPQILFVRIFALLLPVYGLSQVAIILGTTDILPYFQHGKEPSTPLLVQTPVFLAVMIFILLVIAGIALWRGASWGRRFSIGVGSASMLICAADAILLMMYFTSYVAGASRLAQFTVKKLIFADQSITIVLFICIFMLFISFLHQLPQAPLALPYQPESELVVDMTDG